MVSDGYVKCEKAEVHRSFTMQNFQDDKKKLPTSGHYILFYIHGPAISHFFFELRKYHKIQSGRFTAILNLFAPKS